MSVSSAALFTGIEVRDWLADALGRSQVEGLGDLERGVATVSTDSRTMGPGALFCPLVGERFDGHAFLNAAFAAGAIGALSQMPVTPPPGRWVVRVDDTLAALQALAAHWRRLLGLRVVAITGSCGKTTTREMVRLIADAAGLAPCASAANHNNEIGVPLTLLALRRDHRLGIVEVAMNHPGEIALLTRLVAPDVGLISRVGEAHLEGVGSREGVARAKRELLEEMAPGRRVVLNRDDPSFSLLARGAVGSITTFGRHRDADLRWQAAPTDDGGQMVSFTRSDGADFAVHLADSGEHLAEDAAAAAAAALTLGIGVEPLVVGLARFHALSGRGRRHPLPGGGVLIDDTYNANPDSMRAAMRVLEGLPAPRLAVLGDMLELGDAANDLHGALGEEVAAAEVEHLIAVGGYADIVVVAAGLADGVAVPGWEEAVSAVRQRLAAGCSVLVKGSRGVRLDRLVATLVGEANCGGAPVRTEDTRRTAIVDEKPLGIRG
jgi:UDP-N-acetylmuramoyl-tripeptide--D-alanyl-D-alanine ligase